MNARHLFSGRLVTLISLVIPLVLFLPTPAVAADVPFSPANTITDSFGGAKSVYAADVDGDGDLDVLGAAEYGSGSEGYVTWWENTAGDGTAWTGHIVSSAFSGANSVYAADVDGDGDMDVLGAAEYVDTIAWWENTAGDGSAWTEHILSNAFSGAYSVYAADVDGDGDMDVLGTAYYGYTVAWWENTLGNGSAWTEHILSSTFNGAASVYAADVDGDGDLDVLGVAQYAGTIVWWENTAGDGSAWTPHDVGGSFITPFSVHAADVDGDGDVDVLSADFDTNKIICWENTAGDGLVWTPHDVGTGVDAMSVYAGDVDGDGDLDVLGTSFDSSTVAWWENTAGNGSAWTQHTLSDMFGGPKGVYGADVDGDGDLDLLGAAWGDSTIAWWENETIHRSAAYPPAGMHTLDSTLNAALSVYAADLDGDGDMDVLGQEYNPPGPISWWENTAGDGSAWTKRTVDSAFVNAISVYAADIDGDGDLDVIAGSAYLAWWENTAGDGSAWTKHSVATGLGGKLSVADVDGDGDLDLVGHYSFGDTVAWMENTASDGTTWTQHVVSNTFDGVECVYAADVDGDGDVDVLGAAWNTSTIAWWENTAGDGTAWTEHLVASGFTSASCVYAADMDGDGDLDVLGVATNGSTIAWWENTAGDGSAWTQRIVSSAIAGPRWAFAADVDGDGDLDVLGAASSSNAIVWWENTAGDGSAWTQHIVSSTFTSAMSVYAADADGDGDLDVMGAAWTQIAWWENLGGQFALATTNTAPTEIVSGQADDLLKVTMTHLGRAGDSDEEWATAALLFEDQAGTPLDSGPANALIASLDVYGDDGSGAFEPGADTLVTTVDTLALVNGVQTVTFADGDPNVQVAYGAPRTYFVVVELTPFAWYQLFNNFCVTHLTDPATGPTSSAEDRDHDLGLTLEYAANTASSLVSPSALADLAISQTASDDLVVPGQTLTYTLVYTNYGPSTADFYALGPTGTIVITDLVPAILTNVTYTASDPALTPRPGSTYIWSLWHLDPGESGIVTITGVVDPALSDAQPISNTAAIDAFPPDPDLSNNSASTLSVVEIPIAGLAAANSGPTTLGQATALTATIGVGSNVAYAWAPGDGGTAYGAAATHLYSAAGSYIAVVTASNPVSVVTATTVVEITNLAPIADAGPDQAVIVYDPVSLDGSASADPDGHLPLSYGWAQTAGLPVVLSDPAAAQPTFVAPASPTTLQFSLVVTDAYDLAASVPDAVLVTVGDTPIGGLSLATSSPTPFGQPTFFTATVESGSNVVFSWDWGDGGQLSKPGHAAQRALEQTVVISHTYSAAGTYTAVVTAANGAGAESLGTTVEITAPPACLVPLTGASLAGLPEAYVDLTWFFTATLEPADATAPITYTWSPEPVGGQGTGAAAYSWAATGTVTLTVLAQNCGGEASTSFAVQVLSDITATVDPGVTTTIVYTDPQQVTTTIIIPPDSISQSITLVFAPNPTPTHPISDDLVFANHSFDLDAYLGQQILPGFVFSEPISVSIHYTDEDIAGIQETGLLLYYWTGSAWADGAGTCSPPSTYSRDLALNRLAVAICHLTEWNIQGPDSLHIVHLPLIVKDWTSAPDLVVERIVAAAGDVQVVIRNQGNAPAVGEFWVDLYVDPNPPPARVNQTWDQLGDEGLVWGVSGGALPLAPGEAITLTVGDAYFWVEYSHVDWPLPPGTPVYAQVDSAGEGTYGGVLETHEIRGEPYNNISGPVYVMPGLGRAAPVADPPALQLHLPPR